MFQLVRHSREPLTVILVIEERPSSQFQKFLLGRIFPVNLNKRIKFVNYLNVKAYFFFICILRISYFSLLISACFYFLLQFFNFLHLKKILDWKLLICLAEPSLLQYEIPTHRSSNKSQIHLLIPHHFSFFIFSKIVSTDIPCLSPLKRQARNG